MRIRVPKTFVPKEARVIASSFRKAAGEARAQATKLRGIGNNLEGSWKGNSKNRFMTELNPQTANLIDYANYLEQCARTIERMKVTTWEMKEVEDPKK